MAKKKNSKKNEKNAFLGNLDRLGGKKLMQHGGADESSRERNRASIPLAGAANPADAAAGGKSIPVDRGIFPTEKHNKSPVICTSTICLFLYCLPASAHHGNAACDLDNPITLRRTVTEFVWSNPHVQIYFDVINGQSAVMHWASETVSPGMLSMSGWSKSELKPGEKITITRPRQKRRTCRLRAQDCAR